MTTLTGTDFLIKWLRTGDKHPQKKIIEADELSSIIKFVTDFATPLDCNEIACVNEAIRRFPEINRITVRAVVDRELAKQSREQYRLNKKYAPEYLAEFYASLDDEDYPDADQATKMCALACRSGVFLSVVCSLILSAKYKCTLKSKLNSYLRCPMLIPDEDIRFSVMKCLWANRVNGYFARAHQRATAREYQRQLRDILNRNHIPFVDKYYLRTKYGIRKVPTFELLQPFKYRGVTICWIESQIQFGVIKTHINHLKSYFEMFKSDIGTGLVIYWFGLQKELAQSTAALDGVLVADKFPNIKDLEMHQHHVSRTTLVYDTKNIDEEIVLDTVD